VVFAQLDENDNLLGRGAGVRGQVDSQVIEALHFGVLDANTADGHSSSYDLASVDYLFMLQGNWRHED
jgi:hypothetical protein